MLLKQATHTALRKLLFHLMNYDFSEFPAENLQNMTPRTLEDVSNSNTLSLFGYPEFQVNGSCVVSGRQTEYQLISQ